MVKSKSKHPGFTLVEMMVAVVVSSLVVAGVSIFHAHQKRVIYDQRNISQGQQNVRIAYDTVARDLRMTGYGLDVLQQDLDSWVSWETGMDSNPHIVSASAGDTMRIATAFGEVDTQTILAAPSNSVSIVVRPGKGSLFNLTDQSIIYLDRTETARITAIAGDVLTISTHPTQVRGTEFAYAPGADIEIVDVITYDLVAAGNSYPERPYLRRRVSGTTYAEDWHAMVAGDIIGFTVTQGETVDKDKFTLTVTARTADEALYYESPEGDGYRRRVMSGTISLRN